MTFQDFCIFQTFSMTFYEFSNFSQFSIEFVESNKCETYPSFFLRLFFFFVFFLCECFLLDSDSELESSELTSLHELLDESVDESDDRDDTDPPRRRPIPPAAGQAHAIRSVLEFYILATPKVISGWVPICDCDFIVLAQMGD